MKKLSLIFLFMLYVLNNSAFAEEQLTIVYTSDVGGFVEPCG